MFSVEVSAVAYVMNSMTILRWCGMTTKYSPLATDSMILCAHHDGSMNGVSHWNHLTERGERIQ